MTLTMTLTLSNAALADRIKQLPTRPEPIQVEHDLATLLAAVLAAPLPSPSGSAGINDKDNDCDDYGLPTLLPLYLSRLLSQDSLAQAKKAAAHLILNHLGDSSLPLARRLRGTIVLICLFRAAPPFALDIFLLHAQDAFLESISDTLEPAADAPAACWSKPPVAQLVVALLDLLSLAASHAAARPLIAPLVPYLRVLARSSSSSSSSASPWASRGATFATNVLTKLANNGDASPTSAPSTNSSAPPLGNTSNRQDDMQDKVNSANPESSIQYLTSTFVADTTHARERESLMESMALLSIQPCNRLIFMSSPSLAPLIALFRNPTFLATLTPSLAYGFATLLHHLTMYPPHLSPEQRQLRRLARFAQSGSRGTVPPANPAADDQETAQESLAATARCTTLVKDHKAMVAVVGVYRSQARLTQGTALSPALASTLGAISCSLAHTPDLRGLLVQQGIVGMLVRLVPAGNDNRPAAQALARCGISLNPAIAFGDQHVQSIATALWTLVTPPAAINGGLATTSASEHDARHLAQYEALLALTNLSTLPTLAPHLGTWFTRLDQAEALTADHLDLRRAAWELLCNLAWTSPDVLNACLDPARKGRLDLLLDLAVAHAHAAEVQEGDDGDDNDDDVAMRRAVLGVLAALTCAPPVVQYLAEHVSEHHEGGEISASHLQRLVEVTRQETNLELVHRLCQLWVHVVEDQAVGRAWSRKAGVKQVLLGCLQRAKGHAGVAELVQEAFKSLD